MKAYYEALWRGFKQKINNEPFAIDDYKDHFTGGYYENGRFLAVHLMHIGYDITTVNIDNIERIFSKYRKELWPEAYTRKRCAFALSTNLEHLDPNHE